MAPIAYFGINSSGLTTAIDLLIVFVVVLYLSLLYWTFADARRRIADPALIGCATVASLFPFVGTIIYMVLRPPEYLEDVRERELEMQAAEARLYQLDYELCPHCDYRIERDFIRCPSCLRKLKDRCVSCTKPLDRAWTMCPYCETEVSSAGAPTRARRRRATIEAETAAARGMSSGASEQPEVSRSRPTGRSSSPSARSRTEQPTSTDLGGDSGLEPESPSRSKVSRAPEPAASRPRGQTRASRPRPTP
jgi:hypothetical protein